MCKYHYKVRDRVAVFDDNNIRRIGIICEVLKETLKENDQNMFAKVNYIYVVNIHGTNHMIPEKNIIGITRETEDFDTFCWGWDVMYESEKEKLKKTIKIPKDRECKNMKIKQHLNFNLFGGTKRIVDIKESTQTRTRKVPQKKAKPIIIEEEYKVVTVKFSNGSQQEAYCLVKENGVAVKNGDVYDIARGIEVCVLKEMFGSTKNYNRFLKDAVKKFKEDAKIDAIEKEEAEIKKRKQKKSQERKAKLQAKIAAQERQEKIDIQTEAYYQALKKLQKDNENISKK